jgi:hypothetical protein
LCHVSLYVLDLNPEFPNLSSIAYFFFVKLLWAIGIGSYVHMTLAQ